MLGTIHSPAQIVGFVVGARIAAACDLIVRRAAVSLTLSGAAPSGELPLMGGAGWTVVT